LSLIGSEPCPAYLLALDLLQLQDLGGHLLGVPVHAGAEEHLPGERGSRVAALAHAGQVQLGVLLHGHEQVAGVQAAGVDQQIRRLGAICGWYASRGTLVKCARISR